MLKRKLIIVSGAIAVILLFFIGSFLLYWGVWSRLFGHGTRPAGLDDIMWGSGGIIIFIGIYVASMLVSYLLRKGAVNSLSRRYSFGGVSPPGPK